MTKACIACVIPSPRPAVFPDLIASDPIAVNFRQIFKLEIPPSIFEIFGDALC
jgi:hypothetical protein